MAMKPIRDSIFIATALSSASTFIFALYFFNQQGFALKESALSSGGFFLTGPTLKYFTAEFLSVAVAFFLALFFVFSLFLGVLKLRVKRARLSTLCAIGLWVMALLSSKSLFLLDPDLRIAGGMAEGSVSPVHSFRFAMIVNIITVTAALLVAKFFDFTNFSAKGKR